MPKLTIIIPARIGFKKVIQIVTKIVKNCDEYIDDFNNNNYSCSEIKQNETFDLQLFGYFARN